ncbi:PilZ domain-containing protein [Fusibacter sp. JL298sf-3]
MDNRRDKRYSIGNIESFNFHTTNREVEIQFPLEISLRDISAGGLGIKSNAFLETDTTLSVNLEFEGESFVVIGKIVWCHFCGDACGNKYDCGLKLIYMPEQLVAYFSDMPETFTKYTN